MKVLIVNTSDTIGGAAVAASRLCDALCSAGVKATMLVLSKQGRDARVASCSSVHAKLNFLWERFTIWVVNGLSKKNLFKVSVANAGIDITKTREFKEADIINLHWINQGLLSLKGIARILGSGKPVVWTMHDVWPATAICHHPYKCDSFYSECCRCPFLRFPGSHDLSSKVFGRKKLMLQEAGSLTFVAVSSWLAGKTMNSALTSRFPVKVIPNALPLEDFKLTDRTDARTALDVVEPFVIAFGAARIDDSIKGFDMLTEALRLLIDSGKYAKDDIRLLLFGNLRLPAILEGIPVKYSYLGYTDDSYRLSQIYSASNITVSSSLYETFGQTLIEAMACGSVPVSFGGSGQADIICHKKNGYLANHLSPQSLAEGMAWGLKLSGEGGSELRRELRRSVIRRFAEGVVARQYSDLFSSILGDKEK